MGDIEPILWLALCNLLDSEVPMKTHLFALSCLALLGAGCADDMKTSWHVNLEEKMRERCTQAGGELFRTMSDYQCVK
jgi:hypothetical protein